ncbi:MAG: ribose 5-phosphate isomerase B [Candidatus Coatesbacteria bacterium]|nr:ribose 5-phosphate isomerase B [Candidatus Coatesbacteria bacterium]
MRVAVGADHGGLEVKNRVIAYCIEHGHRVINLGTDTPDSVDYPVYAKLVAQAVARDEADRGVLVCTNGVGMCMAANKIPGIRAALVRIPENAARSRAHNDANVLCLAGGVDTAPELEELLETWFDTAFEGGRHQRRVALMMELDEL